MALKELTRESVLAAVAEYDRIEREAFLNRYGFGPSREYFLVIGDTPYDSKAIAGAAHQYLPNSRPLTAQAFSGGDATVKRIFERLGFVVRRVATPSEPPSFEVGRIYSWDDIGERFDFNPRLFQVGGGMLSRPLFNAVILVTHPGGARSFDYEDRWDGDTLIYTGCGKTGDQRLDGTNREVADNRKHLLVFQASGSRALRFCGSAKCSDYWPARGVDSQGHERDVWKFRLSFKHPVSSPTSPAPLSRQQIAERIPRAFAPDQRPSPAHPTGKIRVTLEEIAAQLEKCNQQHHSILVGLFNVLKAASWQRVEEIPCAVDLWATSPNGVRRIIFEAKTLSGKNEPQQCRAALSQLLEYKFFHGSESDVLCLVVNRTITERRRAFLEQHGVGVLRVDDASGIRPIGPLASEWFAGLTT